MRSGKSLRFCVAVTLVAMIAACEYRSEVGSGELVEIDCEGFRTPVGDCTAGFSTCVFLSDCLGNQRCNQSTGRCFSPTSDCVGTACSFDDDCADGERCNSTAGACYEVTEPQTCMPCLRDSECGGGVCTEFENTCT